MANKVLVALDRARTQLYHFCAIFILGMGLFTDAYDLFCIPVVSNLLGRIYYKDDCGGRLPTPVKGFVEGTALCGALAGQLLFGWLGDRMGRKKVYGITLKLMVVSSIASAFSLGNSRESVLTCLCFFRFWLGLGIGGDYPISVIMMSELANIPTRGGFIAAIFAMQGLGILAGSIVEIVVSQSFIKTYPNPTQLQQDMVWRIILILGAIPAGLTYYWRMKMPETARYTALVTGNDNQAAADMSRVFDLDIEEDEESVSRIETRQPKSGLFSRDFVKHHGLQLLGTASSWFFVDLAFYSSSLFQNDIYRYMGWLKLCRQMDPLQEVFRSAKAQAVIVWMGTLPGYVFTIFLIDRIGRRKIQFVGFFFMSAFLFALAIPYNQWVNKRQHGFLAIYSLTFFFANFGPNTTTFIVPGELFPARLRSTCHGISAAAGKAGAIIGMLAFLVRERNRHDCRDADDKGANVPLIVLAVASCLGFFCTFLIPETMGRSLEENEIEPTLTAVEFELEQGFASTDRGRG